MKVEPSGVVMIGECSIQTPVCQAVQPAPITAVWSSPGRVQIDVCRACLEEMIRDGQWEVEGARVPKHFDVAVYDPSDKLQVVVEVKSQIPAAFRDDKHWAVQVHRNLISHAAIPLSPFFLLVHYPAHFYLWKQDYRMDLMKAPDYEYKGYDLLAPYACEGASNPTLRDEHRYGQGVAAWLTVITQAPQLPSEPAFAWLMASGLFDAIQHGKVVQEASVKVLNSIRSVVAAHG